MSDESTKFMTVEEVMEYLGIARSTVDLYSRQGKLKRFQRGKRTMYLREQVVKLGEPKPKQ
jgi:predicted site-specific integrase-resolvase